MESVQRHILGAMTAECTYCHAKLWIEERKASSSMVSPEFELCCGMGSIALTPLEDLPVELNELLTNDNPVARQFRKFIRGYNSAFGFTSSGAEFDHSLANSRAGVYTYRVQGSVYHLISRGLIPEDNRLPGFAQIYIYDTDYQVERRSSLFPDLDREIVRRLQAMLQRCNPFVEHFMVNNAENLENQSTQDFQLLLRDNPLDRRYSRPTASEVAAILPGEGDSSKTERHITLKKREGGLQRVSQLDGNYDPLHYVLLFPRGEKGWSVGFENQTGITMNQFYRYRLMVRNDSQVLWKAGRLTQEYVVDAYAKMEESRLLWARYHQNVLRASLYQGLMDQVNMGDESRAGRLIILPSSFTGGPRYMQSLYQDAMAIVRKYGKPDLFITMTCNPKWPEITRELLPGQKATDRFDLCCRVFRLKLKAMMDLIEKKKIFGKVIARVHVIEFQKRGLPHAHILLILDGPSKPQTSDDVDKFVCAELPPREDELLWDTVTSHMIHGPCGAEMPNAPCMKDGVCTKDYPKVFVESTTFTQDGFPMYRRRNNGSTVVKGRHCFDNRDVVPYNKFLCKKFNCHINVEVCTSIQSVKYLYKYVYKGHDRVRADVVNDRDEPQQFVDGRYISASEAFWRICDFRMQKMSPSVCQLQVHLENQQSVVYEEGSNLPRVVNDAAKTTLTEWMTYNLEHPQDQLARSTLYTDFPIFFTWDKKRKTWHRRQSGETIGRVYFVNPRDVERFYLRLLLHHVPGATSFQDIRTVDGVIYETFQQAVQARGLLQNDDEFDQDLALSAAIASARQLRELFSMMLLFCELSDPRRLFDKYIKDMGDDFLRERGIDEIDEEVTGAILSDIELILFRNGSSLRNFQSMPQDVHLPASNQSGPDNVELTQDRNYAEQMARTLNDAQRHAYDAVIQAVTDLDNQSAACQPKCFFIDGPGGSGKTYLYRTIITSVEASNREVIATATSGVAALLLPHGRTTHSAFKVPIPVTATSTCNIPLHTKVAREVLRASVVIVDEAPMMQKTVYEAIDRSFRDIMKEKDSRLAQVPFGGKIMILGGDFRQMLPVIPRGSRRAVVEACVNQSNLWEYFRVFHLTANVRVGPELLEWSNYLLSVGEGQGGESIPVPEPVHKVSTVDELIQAVFPDMNDPTTFNGRAILTLLNTDVSMINDKVLRAFPGDAREYQSVDEIPPGEVSNVSLYPTEFLNTIEDATVPAHKLRLKIGCIVLLLRNLDTTRGLCNGTRLRVDGFYPRMLKVTIVSEGAFYGQQVLLPRIALYPSETRLPFQFKRLQFPVRLAFAVTINKSQGQTLERMGLYLSKQPFAHGHLYVALSRAKTGPDGIYCLLPTPDTTSLTNVVYREVLSIH